MPHKPSRYKTIKHYHEPGDFHELTFSCYHHMPLLTNDVWRGMLAESIDRAMTRWLCRLHAFVFMPEHVHLLISPVAADTGGQATRATRPRIDALLKAIKRPYSYRIKQLLIQSGSRLLERLTVRERPGVTAFRYWQEGPGYDRNLSTPDAILASIDYIHLNPVRRGLCARAEQWRWSSAQFFTSDGALYEAGLPRLEPIPAGLFEGGI